MGRHIRVVACSVLVSFLFATNALAQKPNFYRLSEQKYCESVMPSLRDKCNTLNAAKEKVCTAGASDIDTHMKQIERYKADNARLEKGDIPNSDTVALKASIEKMKAELDQRKSEAETNRRAAKECMEGRQAVYDFFEKEVIPATQQAAADAKTERDGLLEELRAAEGAQASAKSKRDGLEGADPEKDRARWDEYVKAKDEYETNAEAFREAENKLGQFNSMNGKDIDHDVNGLLMYYKEQQEGHKIAIDQERNRYENWDKVATMSY